MNDRVNQKVNDRINEKDLGRTIVICPKCGENNSNTFRFCGMCGTLLEARRPANATAPASPVAASNLVIAQEPQRSAVVQNTVRDVAENSPRPISRQVPPISGPSMLGLNADPPVADRPTIDRPSLDRPSLDRPSVNQPGVSRPVLSQPGLNQPALHQSALNQIGFSQPKSNQRGMNEPVPVRPEMDSFRPTSFTGLDSFFEHEQPKKTSALRVVLLVVLLAALAAAGWWTYGYLDNAESRKSQVASNAGKPAATPSETQNEPPNTSTNNSPNVPSSVASNVPQNNGPSATAGTQNASPSADAGPSQVPPPSAAVPEKPSENANPTPDTSTTVTAPRTKPSAEGPPVTPSPTVAARTAEKPKPRPTSARALKPQPAADTGTADFQKGEAYLYGRGAPENCDQAVKYLKSASAKSNAKARSAFGTMYATGHCVARDLPTSYLWFAMALRVDPNNQILEKDLSAIWNQMTPPERQLATRMKQ